MSDLRAAAERVLETRDLFEGYGSTWGGKLGAASVALAEAYIADRDESPITAELLTELGFEDCDETGITYVYGATINGKCFPLGFSSWEGMASQWFYGPTWVPTPQSAAELRKLCSALGVELREQP